MVQSEGLRIVKLFPITEAELQNRKPNQEFLIGQGKGHEKDFLVSANRFCKHLNLLIKKISILTNTI